MIDSALHFVQEFKNKRLYYNVQKHNLHLIQLLLDHGADASYKLEDGETPVSAAVSVRKDYECSAMCKLLLEKGAECDTRIVRTGATPLLLAFAEQSLNIVQLLLDHGADITATDILGHTGLHYAAVNPRVDVLEFALSQGFDIERGNYNDYSALAWTVNYYIYENCELLLRRGAMVNRVSVQTGWMPLCMAIQPRFAYNGQENRVVQLLLEYGAEVTTNSLEVGSLSDVSDGIRNVLMQHMAKLECLNWGITQDHRKIIENRGCYKGYYGTCLQELNEMKTAKFYHNVSAYNICMGSDKVLSGFARNDELVKALEENDFSDDFPIYFSCLRKRFYAEVEKQKLRNIAAKILSNLFMFNHPSHPVNHAILRYFTDEDLKFLCSTFLPSIV